MRGASAAAPSATLPRAWRPLARRSRPRRSPSSTWAPTASGSSSGASKATRSSGSTRGARRCASARASTQRPHHARRRGARRSRASRASASGCAAFRRTRCARSRPTRSASRATRREFLPQAEAALGFPIDIISGHEEARLIYLGVAHVLPPSPTPRLVIDIGGGSTEFIIGRGAEPRAARVADARLRQPVRSASSPTAQLRADALRRRRDARARRDRGDRARVLRARTGRDAYASSGTALALADILEQNGMSEGGITPHGARAACASAWSAPGASTGCGSPGLKPRARAGARRRLRDHVGGARRARRAAHRSGRRRACASACCTTCSAAACTRDIRVATVERFIERYHVDRPHAERVARDGDVRSTTRAAATPRRGLAAAPRVGGAAARGRLHRLAPRLPQARRLHPAERRHARLLGAGPAGARAARARLPRRAREDGRAARPRGLPRALLALRLAVLFHHARRPIGAPRIALGSAARSGSACRARGSPGIRSPRTCSKEREEWEDLGYAWKDGRG